MRQSRRTVQHAIGVFLLWICLVPVTAGDTATGGTGIRFGVTPVFLDSQTTFLKKWRDYLEQELGRPVEFKQRSNYREITELLLDRQIDFAWICGYPYVRFDEALQVVAVPLYGGAPVYQSYLIVAADDQETVDLLDLQGSVFAYSDPDSNSGFLVTQYELLTRGYDPDRYFQRTFFTWAHSKVVEAVATGLAEAGAVDGYVWDTLDMNGSPLTARTRVVWRSRPFGFPPIVANGRVDPAVIAAMKEALLRMPDSSQGRQLLRELNLTGFTISGDALFGDIALMASALEAR